SSISTALPPSACRKRTSNRGGGSTPSPASGHSTNAIASSKYGSRSPHSADETPAKRYRSRCETSPTAPWYRCPIVYVGLVTRSRTPRAEHAPRTKVVFPVPSSPATVTTSPSARRVARAAASASVSSGELVTVSATGRSVKCAHACVHRRRDRRPRSGAVRAVQGRIAGRRRRLRRPLHRPRRRARRPRGRLAPEAGRHPRVSRSRNGQAVLRVRALPGGEEAARGRGEPAHGRRRRRLEEAELLRRRRRRGDERELRLRLERAPEQLGEPREIGLEHLEHGGRVQRRRRVVQRIEEDGAPAERRLLLLAVHPWDPERPHGDQLRS